MAGLVVSGAARSIRLGQVLARLQDTTAEIRVRCAVLLLVAFTVLAERFGLESILGVTATQIGVALGMPTSVTAAALVCAGLLSVLIFPPLALVMLRGGKPEPAVVASQPVPVPHPM